MRKLIYSCMLAVAVCMMFSACSTFDSTFPEMGGNNYYFDMNGNMPNPEMGSDKFEDFSDNPFINASEQPISTFSVDADGASYAYMRATLTHNFLPSSSSVRIEEFLNYFTFDYASPEGNNVLAINGEIGDCPWNPEHRLLRLGLKAKDITAEEMAPANYVFLVDVSGSMNGADRLDLLKACLIRLLDELNPTDRISLITYAGNVELVLESTTVSRKQEIKKAINKLGANGSTAGGAAMVMAYKEALKNYIEGGNNRIIMGTDGDFNVGVHNTDSLLEMVSHYADQGIYLTCCGFGMGNLNDAMMEKVSNRGNGTYVYVDCEEEMLKVFVNERSRMQAVANDVKCQVTFDTTQVLQYRLIGYENRVMNNEDFDDDAKDAAEIGAGQTITALYEIVPAQAAADNIYYGRLDVRYKEQLGAASRELTLPLSTPADSTSENLRFAAGVAAYGMVLRNSEYKGSATFMMADSLVSEACSFDPFGYRQELLTLIRKATECTPQSEHWYY